MRHTLLARRLFDLKSHNVLLTRDGTAKIADVGLAKVLTQARPHCSEPPFHSRSTSGCLC
jgi:serine/threonine protein kinase